MLLKPLKLYRGEVKLTAEQLRPQESMTGVLRYADSQYGERDGRVPCNELSTDDKDIRLRSEGNKWHRKKR